MNKLKLAACGLDCNVCGLYNAGHDLKAAESIVEWFRGQRWIEADGNAEAVQKAVQDKKVFCDGCWGTAFSSVAAVVIFACAASKKQSPIAANVLTSPANRIKDLQKAMMVTKKQWNICYQ